MVTLRQVLKNISKGQSGIRTKAIISELENVFKELKDKIELVHAMTEAGGTTIYLKIPSQDKNIFYDIIIWFHSKDRITLDTEFKVYSNSPFFAYNLAYVFNKNDSLLFPNYYQAIIIRQQPKIRNPLETTGFDKHVYSALRFVAKQNLSDLIKMFENKNEPIVKPFEEKVKETEYLKKKGILYK
jgi:hypothetical protein